MSSKVYTVYNKSTGEIIKTVICPANSISIQYDNQVETHIKGDYDRTIYKIVDDVPVQQTELEKDIYQYNLIKNELPPINRGLTDTEIDNQLNDFFHGQEDIQVWKLNNYRFLRKCYYPPIEEYNDAQVKLNSGIPELIQQGQEQLNKYIQDCLDIKTRFPKG